MIRYRFYNALYVVVYTRRIASTRWSKSTTARIREQSVQGKGVFRAISRYPLNMVKIRQFSGWNENKDAVQYN